ncbi:MAG: aldo/keto reductase [Methanobacteriaceae archaeon]|nr:aldo/keto reductase [Methanobacteriaceae archaeon]
MKYKKLGNTGLKVSEIGCGAEWFERHTKEEVKELVDYCVLKGINIMDCWVPNPETRSNTGEAIKDSRDYWIIQGHIGATWQNNQYVRSRNIKKVKEAFEDLLFRFHTDYIDIGMIHFVDEVDDFNKIMNGDFIEYVHQLKYEGKIKHVGLSTHNPIVAKMAAESGEVEMILFSINPAFDLLPASEDILDLSNDTLLQNNNLNGVSKERMNLYKICEDKNISINVMKGFAGGRLFSNKDSPLGVKFTPVQCIHYALTRPSVCSIMVGYDTTDHIDDAVYYENATDSEKDFSQTLSNIKYNNYIGQCTYCGHCAPCKVGIDIAMVNKFYDLIVTEDNVSDSLCAHHNELSKNAYDCIECGDCEKACPFGVEIISKMRKAKKVFKNK